MTDITGPARLAANPELKTVGQGDDKRYVCEMRVRLLNPRAVSGDDGSVEWEDNGFWANVNVWGKCGESAAHLFEKGDRILVVSGNLIERRWKDKDDPEKTHSAFQVDTNLVAPWLPDIDVLKYRERKRADNGGDQNA